MVFWPVGPFISHFNFLLGHFGEQMFIMGLHWGHLYAYHGTWPCFYWFLSYRKHCTVQCTQDQQNTNKQITESATASAVAVALTAAAKAASASSVEATLASAAVAASAKKKAKKVTQQIDR